MGEPGTRDTLATVVRTVRRDLWTTEADARPRTGRSGWLSWVEHLALTLFGLALLVFDWNRYVYGYRLGALSILIVVVCQAAAPLVSRYRPMPALWMSTLAQVAVVVARFGSRGPGSGWLPDWSGLELALQAWVLFRVALRHRPRAAAEALAMSVVTSLLFDLVWGYAGYATVTVAALAIAALAGSSLRGRKVARDRLIAQEEVTAEERARRTLLEERTRIARELHDVVAHHMSVISIQAQVAPHLVENPSAELKENLASIHQNAKDALTELRQVLGVLRSEHPDPASELHAPQPTLGRLDELVANVRAAGLHVTTRTTGEPVQLAQGVELSAFRIIQEAVSNAMRHAPGAEIRVDVEYHPSDVTVRIGNTAPGGSVPPSPGAGHGLLGMRERAAMLGGALAFGPTADGGYEVTATLPAHPSAESAEPAESAEAVEDTA